MENNNKKSDQAEKWTPLKERLELLSIDQLIALRAAVDKRMAELEALEPELLNHLRIRGVRIRRSYSSSDFPDDGSII